MHIITTYHVLKRLEYKIKAYTHHTLHHEYKNTSIHSNYHTKEQDPTTDEKNKKKNDIHPTNPRLLTRNLSFDRRRRSRRRTPKQANIALSQVIAVPVPATIFVVICEPRGLGYPITMGIKTSKA